MSVTTQNHNQQLMELKINTTNFMSKESIFPTS